MEIIFRIIQLGNFAKPFPLKRHFKPISVHTLGRKPRIISHFCIQLNDYITENQYLQINFKEYLAWFRQINAFDLIKEPQFYTGIVSKRVLIPFRFMTCSVVWG